MGSNRLNPLAFTNTVTFIAHPVVEFQTMLSLHWAPKNLLIRFQTSGSGVTAAWLLSVKLSNFGVRSDRLETCETLRSLEDQQTRPPHVPCCILGSTRPGRLELTAAIMRGGSTHSKVQVYSTHSRDPFPDSVDLVFVSTLAPILFILGYYLSPFTASYPLSI